MTEPLSAEVEGQSGPAANARPSADGGRKSLRDSAFAAMNGWRASVEGWHSEDDGLADDVARCGGYRVAVQSGWSCRQACTANWVIPPGE